MLATKYNDIKRFLQTGTLPSNFSSTESNFRREASNYAIVGGQLMRDDKLVLKFADRLSVFNGLHNDSHPVSYIFYISLQ